MYQQRYGKMHLRQLLATLHFYYSSLTSAFQVKEKPKQVNRPLICTLLSELIAVYKVISETTCVSACAHLLQRGSPQAALLSSNQIVAHSAPFTTKQSFTFSGRRRGRDCMESLFGHSEVMFCSAGYLRKLPNCFERSPSHSKTP